MITQKKWRLSGDYFENCNCDVVCPCLVSASAPLTARPSQGMCDVALVFHIDKGSYDDVTLDGLQTFLDIICSIVLLRFELVDLWLNVRHDIGWGRRIPMSRQDRQAVRGCGVIRETRMKISPSLNNKFGSDNLENEDGVN